MVSSWQLQRQNQPPAKGLKTQGLKTQGLKTQGLKTRGLKTQGLKTRGLKTQGLKAQGQIVSWLASLWGVQLCVLSLLALWFYFASEGNRKCYICVAFTLESSSPVIGHHVVQKISNIWGKYCLKRIWEALIKNYKKAWLIWAFWLVRIGACGNQI